ncbi:MAG: hypothetical protein Q4D04_08360 [Clostridia bacterium]|nr:hypothetical protein [Clostridia bacterium]
MKKRLTEYCFDKPIRIVAYRSAGLDIMFYSALLGLCVALIVYLLCFHEGVFVIKLTIGRTLGSIPLIMLAMLFASLLKELRIYTRKLLKKNVWSIEELMRMTGKDRKETERIITRVLESSFIVDEACRKI